jgi:hypothetical protein
MSNDGLLNIALDPEGLPPDAIVAGEVIDARTAKTLTMPMSTHRQTVSVPAGVYLVRAALPSGDLVTRTVEVRDGTESPVTLRVEQPGGPGTKGATTEPVLLVWTRLWRGTVAGPLPAEPAGAWTPAMEHVVEVPVERDAHVVQAGGDQVAWRFVALPPAQTCRLTLTRVPAVQDFDDGVRVRAWGTYPRAQAMLRYLTAGQLDQAKIVAGDVVQEATGLFSEKAASPEGAAIAGYLMLRVHQIQRLRDWPDNFANWFGWLPDAHVIHAWQLLRERRVPQRDLARRRLLDAVHAGIPRYTEGLRLLFEGLRMFAATDRDDGEVRAATDRVRQYASCCDWTAPQTTYWGAAPDEPSLKRQIGRPRTGDRTQFRVGV